MLDSHFKKKSLKKRSKKTIKMLYRKTIDEATQQQIFQAVSLAVKDVIIDNWLDNSKTSMRKMIRRSYIICPWSSLWAVPLETT